MYPLGKTCLMIYPRGVGYAYTKKFGNSNTTQGKMLTCITVST